MGYDMYWVDRSGDRSENYFHLNVWGMSRAIDLMSDAGMICQPTPPSRDDWNALPEADWDHEDDRGGPEYQAAADALKAGHNGECPGIPLHKFCSNDGWIVTPAEIRSALAAARSNPPIEPPDWWIDWLRYLESALDHGGVRVR